MRLQAWTQRTKHGSVIGCFRALDAPGREPAAMTFDTVEQVRHWVEREARAIGAPVEWLSPLE